MLRRMSGVLWYGFAALFLSGLVMSCGGGAGGGSSSGGAKYTLSGTVSGTDQQGVMITLSGAGTRTTTTNTGGAYSFGGLANGYYTVTASRANYKFTPASQMVPVNYANAVGTTIVSENAFTLAGHVADGSAVATTGVTMTLTGTGLASALTATTDGSGNYTYSAVPGDYTVTPGKNSIYDAGLHTLTTYSFAPPSQPVTIIDLNIPDVNFVTTVTTTNAYNVSGKIIAGSKSLTTDPFILEGVTVFLGDPLFITAIWTTTDVNGNYTFTGVPNGDYAIKASYRSGSCPAPHTTYSFSPSTQAITVNGADFAVSDFVENLSRAICLGF